MTSTQPIIVDTSALISLFASEDSNHTKAVALSSSIAQAGQTIIIPSDVFTETLNVLGRREGHEKAFEVGHTLLSGDYAIDVAPADLALVKFAHQPRSVSFTDCLVMACADTYGTKLIFGFDEVFRKNGYEIMQ